MKTFKNLNSFPTPSAKTVVTIGTFDGVHVGHLSILKKLLSYSKEKNCYATVLTFFPHPRMVLQKENRLKLLNTIEEKTNLLAKIGIDNLIIHPFDEEFSKLSAEDFVKKILVEKLNVQKIIIGYDHRFGRNRAADITDLIAFGAKYNFEVEEISAKEISAISVSSTKIRKFLKEGNMETANAFLGYAYFITGIVVTGNQIGRSLNFPTANIAIQEDYKLIPKSGVYVVSCNIENCNYFGMANIGTNPTVSGVEQKIEVHLFHFNTDIYNSEMQVNFHHRIREEIKFETLEKLKEQLQKDKQYSEKYIHEHLC